MSSSDRLHFKRDVPGLPDDLATGTGQTVYVYEDAQRIGWSTRLGSLLGLTGADLRPDPLGFAEQLAGTLGAGPRTLFAHVRRLAPAVASAQGPAVEHRQPFLDALDERLRRLLPANGRPGLLLGGGLYSGLLAGALQRTGRAFDVAVLQMAGSADGNLAQAVGRACGARTAVCDWGAAEQSQALERWLPGLEEPNATPADLALMAARQRLRDQGATLVLSGHAAQAALGLSPGLALFPTSLAPASPWLQAPRRLILPAHAAAPGWTAAQRATSAGRLAWVEDGLPLRHPLTDPALPRPASRAALAQLSGAAQPLAAEHAPLRASARPMLAPWQDRLKAATRALQGTEAGDILDPLALADMLGSHYAGHESGQALTSDVLWRAALLLLWWTEVLPLRKPPPESAAPVPAVAPSASPATAGTPLAPPTGRPRLVVYTALIGAKEALADPLDGLPEGAASDLELDFVCVTDDPALRSPVWRMLLIPSGHLPPEKLSRRPKALPHLYFPDERHSLYIDNTVRFKRLPQAEDLLTLRPYLFKAFRHSTRDNPEQEAAAVAMLGYEDVGTICRQMDFYAKRRPLDTISPLTTATVLLRDHAADAVQRFGTLWWESVLAFSKRDQLSFDFALQESGCAVEYFEGTTQDNTFIDWNGSLAQHRVRASFDGQRYAWLHREDPEALRDPRAHFLAHPGGSDAPYQKPASLLEYVCWSQGSSLGAQVSPRRDLAGALEGLLAPHRRAGQRFLLFRVQGGTAPHAWLADEQESAARALSMYLGPARGTLLDVPAAELDTEGRVYLRPEPPCDLVIVLGATGRQTLAAVQMVHRMVDPARGQIVLALCDGLGLRQAASLEDWLGGQYGTEVRSQLHASRHDDDTASLPNTLLAIQWDRATRPAAVAA